MGSYIHNPSAWLALSLAALGSSSVAWAWLTLRILTASPGPTASRPILAGLSLSIPAICLATAMTVTGQTYGATTAGSGAAVTYLLLLPSIVLGRDLIGNAWILWRRTVLPFCLVTVAMCIIIGATGHFQPLDGQFLITLFLLGTWLFKLEVKAATPATARSPGAASRDATTDKAERDFPDHLAAGAIPDSGPFAASLLPVAGAVAETRRVERTPATNRVAVAVVAIAAVTLSILAAVLFVAAEGANRAIYLVPALGALTCAGPLVFAARSSPAQRCQWAGALGYAAMTAACLVPGLAGFLQPSRSAPPLYGPDGAFLALAAGLLLSLGEEGLAGSRTRRHLLWGTWGIWLAWILLSVLLARHPVVQSLPIDPSPWE